MRGAAHNIDARSLLKRSNSSSPALNTRTKTLVALSCQRHNSHVWYWNERFGKQFPRLLADGDDAVGW
ncbi:hypothetical protein PSPO01_12149 [Paraphaeosphaeria sporulosa]